MAGLFDDVLKPSDGGLFDDVLKSKPEPDPGYLGEAGRALKRGFEVTIPESTGKALKFFGAEDTGQGLIDYAKSNDTPDLQESAVGKKARDDAWYSIRGNIAPAADNAVLSMAPGAAGAAIGAGIGAFAGPGGIALGALAGYGIGSIASLPIFYGSQAQESYEAVLKHQRDIGTPEEDAQRIARATAHTEGSIEAGGELVQDFIPFAKLFKAFGKPVAKAVVSGVLKPTLVGGAKTVGQVVGGEVITEMGQQAGEDWARKAIGDTGEGATWDETRKVIMPTALMSVVPGGAGAGAHHYKRTVALNALSSPETDPDMRARIAVGAAAAMADGNEDVSRAFAKYASDQIEAKAPIEIKDDDQFYLQYKLSAAKTGQEAIDAAEAALAAPVDALAPNVAEFQSDFEANRVPADSAVAPIGVDLQGPPAPAPTLALPTDTAPATGPLAAPLSLTSEQIVATADRLSGMPVGAQTQELLALDRPTRQAVVKAMQPSGIVTPTVLDAGQGQAGQILNDATTAASSVQPVGDASATNVPAYTERAARERVSKETGMEMRPHRDVPNRFEVVPVTPEPTSNARIAPPTLPVSPTQQQLAEQETPAAPATRPVVPAKPLTPAQLELNRMAADAERSSLPRKSIFRNSQLRDADSPDIKGEKVTHNMRRFLTQIGKLTGTKVVFEYAPEDSEGAVPIRGENVIHINTAAQINPLQVMGHEVTHVLKDRHREAWITIRDALVATMPDKRKALEAFSEDYWYKHPDRLEAARAMPDWSKKLTPEQMTQFNSGENTIEAFLLDEMTSDLGGSHWSSEQFWTDVFAKIEAKHGGEKAKGIIQRLVASIKEALNKFLMVVRAQKQGDYTTVTPEQLEATRDAVTSAYAKFINEERTATPEHSPRTLDRRIRTSDITSRSQGTEPQPAPEKQQATLAPDTNDIDDLEAAREDELAKLTPQRKDQRLFFEVAPNPKDAAAVAAWRQLTDSEKQAVSNDVVERIIPGLLRDIGVTGKVVTQLGGWKAHTNPSFALVVTKGDALLAARAIGYALDQEAVYAMGLKPFTGSTKTGIIHFDLGGKKAHDIYKQVRKLARAIITGHSTVGNEMMIGVPIAQMNRLESAIDAIARKNDVAVNFDTGHGAIVKENDYGIQQGLQDSSGQHSAEGRIADWRTKARAAFGGQSDEGSGGSDRAVSRSEVRPSYGKAIDQHAVSVTGVHYSNAKRTELNSEFYGTGYRGAERARLASATDPRIKRRVYFYTNNGSGITPESGVGYHAHSVDLNNLYNADADPLNLSDPDSNKFESNVIDAGYDGYYTRNFGKNGAAVLLGAHAVPVKYEGVGTRPDVAAPVARRTEQRPPSWYYSPLARAAESATMKTAPASGWKDWLKSLPAKGVKPDEIKWSGIEEWLDVQGKQPVTKQQVQSFLSDFGIKVETILRGERNPRNSEAVSQDIDADEEPAELDISFGEWETDEPDESWLRENAADRLQEEIDERVEQERGNIEDELRDHVEANVTPESYVDDIRSDAGKLFPLTDDELDAEASRRAAMDYAAEHWQSFADDPDSTLDTGTEEEIEQAMERAFAVASGDEAALETEAERRARAEIDEDKLLEELVDREREWYYKDSESPATRTISVDGVDDEFYHYSRYGEQELYYNGTEIPLPRRADDADIEGAIYTYLAENDMLPEGVGPSDGTGFVPTKWEGYRTDKGRAVPGSYREVQLTLPPGTHGEVKSRLLDEPRVTYTVYDAEDNSVASMAQEENAKKRAEEIGGRYEKVVENTKSEHVDANDFIYTVHWNEKNVVGFARFDVHIDKDGKRVMVLQEIQGDWGQQLRDGLKAQEKYKTLRDAEGDAQARYSDAIDAMHDVNPDSKKWPDRMWRDIAQGYELDPSEQTSVDPFIKQAQELRAAYIAKEEAIRAANQAESDARDIPDPAPFISTKKFAVFKDGVEVTRTDKNDKEVTERYGSMKDAEAAAAKKGGEARDLGPQVDTPGWTTLVMKRMIAHAIEYGFDKIVWTNGAQQVERWKQRLRSQVDTIQWEKTEEGVHIVGLYRSRQVVDTKVKETALSSAIGKLMAKQIIADPNQSGEITGDGITIDDLGMHGYYDEIVPFTVNKLLEKLDKSVRVGMHEVHPVPAYTVVDLSKKGGAGFGIADQNGKFASSKIYNTSWSGDTRADAEVRIEQMQAEDAAQQITTQQGFEITDKLRESAANGLPLMSERRRSAEARKANDRRAWYYSQLSVAVNDIPRKIKTGKEAALWLQSNASKLGVKKDELVWSGVLDWLAAQPTPAGVNDWLANNGVRVREVVLGEESPEYLRLDAELDGMEEKIATLRSAALQGVKLGWRLSLEDIKAGNKERMQEFAETPERLDAMMVYGKALNRKNELFEQRNAARGEPVKFDTPDLTLPGGSLYRELLLTLPEKNELPKGWTVEEDPDTKRWWVFKEDGSSYVIGHGSRAGAIADAKEKMQKYGIARKSFIGAHFPQPNIIAHLRFNERTDADGKRVLFIEEVQSDYAQVGRRERKKIVAAKAKELGITEEAASKLVPLSAGFADPSSPVYSVFAKPGAFLKSFEKKAEADTFAKSVDGVVREEKRQPGDDSRPPAAPFVTDTQAWTALALKRAIAYAVDNGFDRVAWTTGEQQAERYDLSKQVESVNYDPVDEWLTAYPKDSGRDNISQAAKLSELPGIIGKEATKKIEQAIESAKYERGEWSVDEDDGKFIVIDPNGDPRYAFGGDLETFDTQAEAEEWIDANYNDGQKGVTISGLDLKVGGEGMIKSYGHSDPNLPVGKDKAGKDLYPIMTVVARQLGATVGTVRVATDKTASRVAENRIRKQTGEQLVSNESSAQPGFDITDAMRKQARIGMPLFSEPRRAPTNNQQQWAGKTVVRNEDGTLRVMYHGTARDITTFRPQQADAIFLTDDPKFAAEFSDLSRGWMLNHYWTWMTPDQIAEAKTAARALLLKDYLPGTTKYMAEVRSLDRSDSYSKYMRAAVEPYMPSESNIMPLYVRAENPFDYRNPEHVAAIEREIGTSWMGQEAINGEMHEVSQHIGDLERGDWNAIESPQVQAYIRARHDSFYVRERGVTNLAVFSPNQVKSASGNTGAYSREDNDIRRSEGRAPAFVPENIWALHQANRRAEYLANNPHEAPPVKGTDRTPTSSELKRQATMAFRRLNQAVLRHVGGDEEASLKLMRDMNMESRQREQGETARRSEARVPNDEMKRINMAQRFGEGLSVVPEDMFKHDTNPGVDYSGEFQTAAEHIGDLIHRLSYREEQGGGVQYGIEAAINKASRFVKPSALDDVLDQLDRNYEYYRDERGYKGSKEDFKRDFRAAATRYAEAYRGMPYATLPQLLAKRAAVNLGELNFPAVRAKLLQLIEILQGEQAEAHYWAPFVAGDTARRSEGRPTTPKELRAWAENKAVTDPTYDMQVVVPADEGATGEKYDDGNPFKVIDGGGNEYGTFSTRKAADAFILEELEGRTYIARQSTPRSRMTGQPINQTWTDPVVTDWDDLVRKMQDDKIDTKRVLRAIRDAGVAVKTKFDAYLLETNYHGRASARVQEFVDGDLRKLLEDMAMRDLSMQDLDDYLWARHAPERNAANNRSNPAITDGSGMSDTQSAAILAGQAVTVGTRTIQLTPAVLRAAAAVSSRVDAITNGTLDLLVSYGLETQQTVDTWKRTYGSYAPLKRDMESDANYSGAFNLGNGTGAGFDVRGSASKRALGSKRAVTDVLANIAMQRERAIARGEKNRVAQAVYGLALSAPNPEFWIPVNTELNKRLSPAALAKVVAELVSIGVNPIDAQNLATEPVQRFIDPSTGLESQRINPALRSRENVLSTRINGEERYVFFSNKKRAQEMVRGLKNLDAAQVSGVLQVIAPVTRWFASINTQYNPIFGLTNGVRDFSTGMLNLSSTDIADKRSEVAREAFDALRGVYADLRDHRAGRAPTSQWAQLFEQFAMDGGQTGYRDAFATSADRADAIAEELKHAGKGQNWLAVGEKRSHIFGWLSDYNTAVENAMRLASYKVYLDKFMRPGMSAQEQQDVRDKAAFTAKNLTVNFNKKGLAAVQTGALYAFFNASVQGTARIAETTLKDGKLTDAGKKIVYGGIMLGVLQAMLGAAAGWDDDEPPQFSREKNFIIPILGTDKVVNVPMPLGFHVLPNIGRITAEWMMSGFKNPGKRLTNLASAILDSFNPIGSGTLAQTLSPTIGDPIVALSENKDWTGKSIYKEDFDKLHPTAGWTRSKDTASPPSKWLSYAINYVTGGGKYGIGMASPTPDTLDYLVSQAFGGTGREVLKVAQYASAKASGEELPMHKMPLGVGRFIGETNGQSSEVNRFYGNLQRIGEHKSALDEMKHAGDGAAIQEYLAENPDARMVQTADKAQREIAYLRRQKRDVLEKGGNPERVKMLDERITATAARYNQVLRGR